jgi:hypothetical protein
MDAKTLQGIVYLVLLCAGGAGLWIFILYQVLGRTRQRVAELETERARLERELAMREVERETRAMKDEELLEDVTDLFARR